MRQHVADVVEAVAGVVRRELVLDLEVEPHQVADRVAILDAIEPADGDAAGIGILRVDAERVAFDPVLQPPHCSGDGRGFFSGGMRPARVFFSTSSQRS